LLTPLSYKTISSTKNFYIHTIAVNLNMLRDDLKITLRVISDTTQKRESQTVETDETKKHKIN